MRSTNKAKLHLAAFTAVFCLAAAMPAAADWRADLGVFRVGIATIDGEPYRPGSLEKFRQALSKALGMPVELFQARDAAALIDAQASSRIEYSILSALGYVTAERLCNCLEPLVVAATAEGATAVRSVLFGVAGKADTIAALADEKVLLGPQGALTGTIIPESDFLWQGRPLTQSGLDVVPTASVEEALVALADGAAGAAFLWRYSGPVSGREYTGPVDHWLSANPDVKLVELWESAPVPFGPHVIRKNLPSEVKDILRRTLADMDETDPLAYDAISGDFAGGFVPVSEIDYRAAEALLGKITSAAGEKAE